MSKTLNKIFAITLAVWIMPCAAMAAQKTLTIFDRDRNLGVSVSEGSGWSTGENNYAIYASTGNIHLWSYAKIKGSVYAKTVTTASGVNIEGDIIAQSVLLESASKVIGSICASNGNVELKSQNSTVSGEINAWGNVTLGANCEAMDSIFATGDVTLMSSGAKAHKALHAGGNVLIDMSFALSDVYSGGYVRLTDGNAQISANAHASGNVSLESGTRIAGSVWAGGTIVNDGTIGGVGRTAQPVPPRILPTPPSKCPDVVPPKTQTFTAGGTNITVTSGSPVTLSPGKYGTVNMGWSSTLTLKAGTCQKVGDPGCYYFTGINGGGDSSQKIRLDFSTGNSITVFSTGDITHSGPIEVSTNGTTWTDINTLYNSSAAGARALARRAYWETRGAFKMTTNGSPRQWLGTVLADGDITIPDNAFMIGSLATVGGSVTSNTTQVTLDYVLAEFAANSW